MSMTRDALHHRLARLLTAEAALACHGLPGAIVVAAAACIAGPNLAAVLRLPEVRGAERRIVLPRKRVESLDGTPLLQLLRLAGAEPVEVEAPDELRAALAEGAAAALFLHGGVGSGEGSATLPELVWACRAEGVPALVACLGETSPLPALDLGAALVVVDPTPLYGAEPAGLILGEAVRVRCCALQERGLGALFRLPEARLAALVAAVERKADDPASGLAVAVPGG